MFLRRKVVLGHPTTFLGTLQRSLLVAFDHDFDRLKGPMFPQQLFDLLTWAQPVTGVTSR